MSRPFGLRQRAELGEELAGRGVDHLEPDDLGRLHVGPALDAGELRVADRRQDDAEEGLADAGDAPQQQVAGVDLALLLLVVGRGNFGEENDVRQDLGEVVSHQGLGALREDGLVEGDGFFEIRMHDGE